MNLRILFIISVTFLLSALLIAQEKKETKIKEILAAPYYYDIEKADEIKMAREKEDKVITSELLHKLISFKEQEANIVKENPFFIFNYENDEEIIDWSSNDIPVFFSSNNEKSPSIESMAGVSLTPEIMVACEYWNGTSSPDKIRIRKSSDHGENFPTTPTVTIDATKVLSLPKIKQITNNEIGVVYQYQYSTSDNDIYFARVGKDLSTPTFSVIDNSVTDCRRPSITSDFNWHPSSPYIYVVYYAISGNSAELKYKLSDDGGQTWSSAITIDNFNSPYNPFCSISYSSGERLAVSYTVRGSTTDDIRVSYSLNWGNDWSTPTDLANTTKDELFPEICIASSSSWYVFYEYHYSSDDVDVNYFYTTNGGSSWNGPEVLSDFTLNERFPTVRSSQGDIYAGFVLLGDPNEVRVYKSAISNPTTWNFITSPNEGNYLISDDDPIALLPKYAPNGDRSVGVAWAEKHGSDYNIYFDAEWLGGSTTTHTLTVQSQSPNSSVNITINPNDNNGEGNGTTTFTRDYDEGTSVTLTAPQTASSNNFLKWQKNGSDYSVNRSISVNVTSDITIKAVYEAPTDCYPISLNSAGDEYSNTNGTTFQISVDIGPISSPGDFLGVSFHLNWDNPNFLELTGDPQVGPWLGSNPVKLIQKYSDHIEVGLSRSDGNGQTGTGNVLNCTFTVKNSPSDPTNITFTLTNVTATQSDGSSLCLDPINNKTISLKSIGIEVWPGDANNDGVVNAADVLPLGLFYGKTGTSRSDGSCEWKAQICPIAWNPENATYADCNGDGVINAADVLCIGLNYSKQHTLAKAAPLLVYTNNDDEVKPKISFNIYDKNDNLVSLASIKEGSEFYLGLELKSQISLLGLNTHLTYNELGVEIVEREREDFISVGDIFAKNAIQLSKIIEKGILEFGIVNIDHKLTESSGEIGRIKMRLINKNEVSIEIAEAEGMQSNGDMVKVVGSKLEKGIEMDNDTIVKEFTLGNYPNPFNPATKIRFTLPKASNVYLTIYNMLGQEVEKVFNGKSFDSGVYTYSWNAANYPSGVYIYQLRAKDKILINKMILTK